MRAHWLFAAFALITACGGDAGTPTNPPPPPPPPQPPGPSSIAIHAGDGQQGEPGVALATRPAAVVRSASGGPVAGAAVTFAIDSGGGQLSTATATTGADGIATAGDWTLGPTPGRNVVTATVGALPPVRFAAIGRFLDVGLIANRELPSNGGTLRYDKAGDSFSGLVLEVPGGAFPATTRWTISARRGIGLPLPADVEQVGPVVTVSNGQGYADSIMALTIPVRVAPDMALGAFYYDSTTGWLEAINLADRSDSTVTVAVRHFSASLMVQPGAGIAGAPATGSAGAIPFGTVVIVIVGVKPGLLAARVGTSFVPGVDDWEFINKGSFLSAAGICAGMSISALYYNHMYKPVQGPLFHRYDTVDPFSEDNPGGIRFASAVQKEGSLTWASTGAPWLAQVRRLAKSNGINPNQLTYHSLVVAMKATGRGQLVAMRGSGIAHAVVAHESNNGTILLADPNVPGKSRQLVYSGGTFQPIPFSAVAGGTQTPMTDFMPMGFSTNVPRAKLDALWLEFKAGTVGNADFPLTTLQFWDPLTNGWQDIFADTATVASDTLIARVNCTDCPLIRGETPPTFRQTVLAFDTLGTQLQDDFPDGIRGLVRPIRPAPTTFAMVHLALQKTSPGQFEYTYVTQQWVTVRSLPTRIAPRDTSVDVDSTATFVARHQGTHPSGARYRWIFANGAADTVNVTGDSTVSYPFSRIGRYKVKLEVRTGTGVLIGRDSATADVAGASYLAFRVDSIFTITKQDATLDSLFARPTDAVLFVYRSPAVPTLGARYPTPGAWLQQGGPGAGAGLVTFNPSLWTFPVAHTVNIPGQRVEGSFQWTGSASDGQLVGRGTYLNQTCTQHLTTVTAQTAGNKMTGSMTYTIDRPGGCDGGAFHASYSWQFVATRVR